MRRHLKLCQQIKYSVFKQMTNQRKLLVERAPSIILSLKIQEKRCLRNKTKNSHIKKRIFYRNIKRIIVFIIKTITKFVRMGGCASMLMDRMSLDIPMMI